MEAGEPVSRKSLRMNGSTCLLVWFGRVDPANCEGAPALSARGTPRRGSAAPTYSDRNPPFRERSVYLPADIDGMAHRSWVSPDGKWILVSEMDDVGWRPCRVLPFDGSTSGEMAGPRPARCTYAGWSPDGRTMYFSADAGDGYHIWRQRFPRGMPEQMTFGATEEEGVAVSPDGRTLVTSAGIRESTVWLHDSQGDRQISGEGFASVPGLGFTDGGVRSVFSPDGKRLFYLVRNQASRAFRSGELWMPDLATGRTEAVLPGVSMTDFDIAPDGARVAFAALDAAGDSHA